MNDLDAAQLRLECLKLAQAAKKMVRASPGTALSGAFNPIGHEEYGDAEDVVKRAMAYTVFIDGGAPSPERAQDTIIGGAADCQNERVDGDYTRKHATSLGPFADFIDVTQKMLELSPYRSCETEYWWVPAGGFIEGFEWRVVRHEAMPDLPWNPVTGHVEYRGHALFCRPLQTAVSA